MQKEFFNQDVSEIVLQTKTDINHGLSISQYELSKKIYGENILSKDKKQSNIKKFFRQFLEPTTLVLVVAGIISVFLKEYDNSIAITVLLLVNSIIGYIQEQKAETSLQAIKKISSAQTTILRDGITKKVPIEDVVVGDIVFLEAGDFVPADLRLFETNDLQVDESALTGESLAVEKTSETQETDSLPLAERVNMAYMNTLVTYGRGKGIVVAVGKETEMGKIAQLLKEITPDKTPLQKQLSEISKKLSILAVIICLAIFGIGVFQGQSIYDIAMSAFSLAIAAIPEGIPLIVTLILVMGIRDMAKNNAIMKNLTAIETAGASDIVLSDKTGTLTQNKMTVTNLYTNQQNLIYRDITGLSDNTAKLLDLGILNNNCTVSWEQGESTILGEPTEAAIFQAAISQNIEPDKLRKKYPRMDEIPFDSARKLMTTVHQTALEDKLVIVKGAPEVLLPLCNRIYLEGSPAELDDEQRRKIAAQTVRFAEEALRVIAVSYKMVLKQTECNFEENLIFVGLFAMIDPPKEEAKETIAQFHQAGIDTAMITGDNKTTATAIAKALGIVMDDSRTISGTELDALTEKELANSINNYRVFARVTPQHKLKIVTAFQNEEHVAIMTGDGVNDAPALKKADIGVSMGKGGTEVAKGAADMILIDDNFSTISYAIVYGRQAYNNIKRSIQLMLSGNIAVVLGIFLTTVLGNALFGRSVVLLNAVQILWFNVVSDTLLSVALGMESVDPSIMQEKPRKKKESFFGNGLGRRIILHGSMIGLVSFVAYVIGATMGGCSVEALTQANTMAFMTLSFAQFLHAFNLKSETESAFQKIFSNKILVLVFCINIILQLLIMLLPILRERIFEMNSITPQQWAITLFLSISPLIIVELKKLIVRAKRERI